MVLVGVRNLSKDNNLFVSACRYSVYLHIDTFQIIGWIFKFMSNYKYFRLYYNGW